MLRSSTTSWSIKQQLGSLGYDTYLDGDGAKVDSRATTTAGEER